MSALPIAASVNSDLGPRLAVHLLNRSGYGAGPGDVQRVLDRGLEGYILDQLRPASDPDVESRLAPLTTRNLSTAQILSMVAADERSIAGIVDEFYLAKVIRAVHSQNQLLEVMVDFWFNHFNVNIQDGFTRYSIMSYERDALRPRALGRFRDLLGATAEHPAMVYYLDNYLSTVSRTVNGRLVQGLNENYGRELLELHTVGVDAGYTQEHVFDAARCFTGWTIDNLNTGGNFIFRTANHDRDAKRVFGLSVPAGGLKDDGDKLLDYLATHPATARFISTKLVQRFVSDVPPESLVSAAAQRFLDSGGDIAEVMKAILGSKEFWAEAFGGGKVRTPLEFVTSAIRAVDGQVGRGNGVTNALANMGLPLYQCIPPTGYSAKGSEWVNPSSHLSRMNFGLDLAAGAVAGVTVDLRNMVRGIGGNPDDARSIASTMGSQVFGTGLSPETGAAIARLSPVTNPSVVSRAVGLVLASPEMQWR